AALGMSTAYVPCNTTVVKWFVARRGLAVGLASSGASVGTVVLPPVAQLLVTTVGWRTAYVIFGVGIFVLLNLVAQVMRRDPESLGLHPDGASRPLAVAVGAQAGAGTLARVIRTRAFWMLVRRGLHALRRDRRRLLRPQPSGRARRVPLRAGRGDGRVGAARRGRDLRRDRELRPHVDALGAPERRRDRPPRALGAAGRSAGLLESRGMALWLDKEVR